MALDCAQGARTVSGLNMAMMRLVWRVVRFRLAAADRACASEGTR